MSAPSWFGTRISVVMVRVAGSSSPAARVTWPANVRPGYSRTVTLPETPGRTPGATSWGTCTKTRAGSIAAILKSGWLLPARHQCADLDRALCDGPGERRGHLGEGLELIEAADVRLLRGDVGASDVHVGVAHRGLGLA